MTGNDFWIALAGASLANGLAGLIPYLRALLRTVRRRRPGPASFQPSFSSPLEPEIVDWVCKSSDSWARQHGRPEVGPIIAGYLCDVARDFRNRAGGHR
jgi:hypothetical protein